MAEKPAVYTWHGVWDEGAGGWQEYYGAPDGLPVRDLTAEDVAGFNDEQRAKLATVAGRRLYAWSGKGADPRPAIDLEPAPDPAAVPDGRSGDPVPELQQAHP